MIYRPARGFTLIEMIASILLLALAFGALMQVAGSSLNLTTQSTMHNGAALWARSKLETLGQLDHLEEGSSEGRFDDIYRWRMRVVPWTGALVTSQNLRIYKVDIDVLWGTDKRAGVAHFSTLCIPVGPAVQVVEQAP